MGQLQKWGHQGQPGCRGPHQQSSRDHTAASPPPPQHCGAEGGGCGEPPGEVSCLLAAPTLGPAQPPPCFPSCCPGGSLGSPGRRWEVACISPSYFSIFLVMGYCEQDLASLLENMPTPFSEAQVGGRGWGGRGWGGLWWGASQSLVRHIVPKAGLLAFCRSSASCCRCSGASSTCTGTSSSTGGRGLWHVGGVTARLTQHQPAGE